MEQYRNFLTFQIDRYLSSAGHYQPIWKEWRSFYAGTVVVLLFAWGVSVILFLLLVPLLFPVNSSYYSPIIQTMLLVFPIVIVSVFLFLLILVRRITTNRRHALSTREFASLMNMPMVSDDIISAIRKSLADCYCVAPNQITPDDNAKRLSRYGFVLHPTMKEFFQVLAEALQASDPSLACAIETLDEIGPFQNVREIVAYIGSISEPEGKGKEKKL